MPIDCAPATRRKSPRSGAKNWYWLAPVTEFSSTEAKNAAQPAPVPCEKQLPDNTLELEDPRGADVLATITEL